MKLWPWPGVRTPGAWTRPNNFWTLARKSVHVVNVSIPAPECGSKSMMCGCVTASAPHRASYQPVCAHRLVFGRFPYDPLPTPAAIPADPVFRTLVRTQGEAALKSNSIQNTTRTGKRLIVPAPKSWPHQRRPSPCADTRRSFLPKTRSFLQQAPQCSPTLWQLEPTTSASQIAS